MSAELEREVKELKERVALLESYLTEAPAVGPSWDQYDSAVIDRLTDAEGAVRTAVIQRWYRRVGVRQNRKVRNRIKSLAEDGLIEYVEPGHWRYVGPRQDKLEAAT